MIEDSISIFVKNQLPDFYRNEGPRFVAFLEAYYEWLESEGQALGYSRDLMEIRDVDQTLDMFIEHFRSKYLVNVRFNPKTSNVDLIKHASEIYRAKGSSRAVQLLFLLVFNEASKIYYPGDDVLRASDGDWVIPRYLELSKSVVGLNFAGKSVLGTASGATALVERVDRRNINGKTIDVAYLSSVVGLFQTGERVVPLNTGETAGAPLVVGSLTTIDILSPGRDFNTGDVVSVESQILGTGALARVANTGIATGRVSFTLVDGGTGYTTSANVLISEKVLNINTATLSYANAEIVDYVFRESLTQSLSNIEYTSPNTTFTVGTTVQGRYANGDVKSTGTVLEVGNSFIVVQNTSSDFTSTLTVTINATAGAVIAGIVDRSANGVIVGSNTTSIGVVSITNPFIAQGSIRTITTGISANIVSISSGQNATFNIGLLTDTETIFLNTDLIGANNVSNTPYLTLLLNAASYGFPKLPSGDLNNILNQVLNTNTFVIGTIASLSGINPGTGYNTDPFVKVIDDNIAPFDRKNLILFTSNNVGVFTPGEDLLQQYDQEAYFVNVTAPTTSFIANETVQQTQANTNVVLGVVKTYTPGNTTILVLATQPFDTTANVIGLTSNATAVVNAVAATTDDVFTKGKVISSNSSSITIKRTRFATSFADNVTVTGDISGATAYVIDVTQIEDSLAMGNNAIVTAEAGTANGVITQLEVVDSGFAYVDGEEVTLTSNVTVFIGTGIARLQNQGKSEGYWSTSKGFLNNKYLHDGDYYQDYSYEIQSGLSLDTYSAIVKQVVHVAGTRLFGRVVEDMTGSVTTLSQIDITLS